MPPLILGSRASLTISLPASLASALERLGRTYGSPDDALALCLSIHLEAEAPELGPVLADFLDRLFVARHGEPGRATRRVVLPAWQVQAAQARAELFRESLSTTLAAMAAGPARRLLAAEARAASIVRRGAA